MQCSPGAAQLATRFGLGAALEQTGVAQLAADGIVHAFAPYGHLACLTGMYLVTMVLGLFVSNNAAVLIMMGLVKSLARQLDMHLKKCVLVLIYCSNLSFATPFSYQTNLMVPPGVSCSCALK